MIKKTTVSKRFECPPCLIICHGKSELTLIEKMNSAFRIGATVVSDNRGAKSIQVSTLPKFLGRRPFHSMRSLASASMLRGSFRIVKNRAVNFVAFSVMDLDDCPSEEIKQSYKNGELLKHHWLYSYHTPIFFEDNMDACFERCGFKVDRKRKVESYDRIAREITKDILSFENFVRNFSKCSCTNFSILLEYFLLFAKK